MSISTDRDDRIQKVLDNSQAVMFYWRAEAGWPVEYVSKNIDMFGYTQEDFLSGEIPYASIIHPDDLERVTHEVVQHVNRGTGRFRQVYRILDKAGEIRWIDDRTSIERDEHGQARHFLGTVIDISEQKATEQHNQELINLIDQSSDQIYVFNQFSLKFTYLNQAALHNIGYTFEEAMELTPKDIQPEMDREQFLAKLKPLNSAERPQDNVCFETVFCPKNGPCYPVDVRVQMLEVSDRLQYVAVVRDISEHKELEKEREKEHQFVQDVVDGIADAVMVINADYSIRLMNKAARERIKPEWVADPGCPKCYEVSHYRSSPCSGKEHPCPLQMAVQSGETVSVIHDHGEEGCEHFVKLTAVPLHDENGEISAIVETAHDITDLMQAQRALQEQAERMHYQASHDELTGLPNRRLFDDRIEHAILRANREKQMMGLAFIDVDKFKEINDSLGHQAGDEVLVEVASRLKNCLRSSDTIARLGGDEFSLIIEGVKQQEAFRPVMDKIMQAFSTPIVTHCCEVCVTISAGVAIYPQDSLERKPLLRRADQALYDVKLHGRNGYRFYSDLT
ncbi:diguanylate cyclase [Thiomicrorhabdus sp. zzn3]|uniref:sensor domain-containing diguanylate cyclase n=1 Tax=Thiomicrorhabdus sp. zzn3 TaxID=3039775 RepID=UPI0024372ECB|nr:sensor domain-containing diguanylate cyclase [Thiomicrorhabdus sp. zzn3]MDG6778873.1 diguanylate cyclase [Thiomicrorhabdus sp. zzn3]